MDGSRLAWVVLTSGVGNVHVIVSSGSSVSGLSVLTRMGFLWLEQQQGGSTEYWAHGLDNLCLHIVVLGMDTARARTGIN